MDRLDQLLAAAQRAIGSSDEHLASTLGDLHTEVQTMVASGTPPSPAQVEQVDLTVQGIKAGRATGAALRSVTASARPGQVSRMAARNRPTPSPERRTVAGRSTVFAQVSAGRIAAGAPITSSADLAELTTEVLNRIRHGGPAEPRDVTVASVRWADAYPADRRLSPSDAQHNTTLMDAVCAPRAVLASGGVCLPVNVDYSVPTWATADRPLRDGLAAFQADRGGLRFVTPPDIGVPSLQGSPSGLGSATEIWTEATDANPAGATKAVYVVQCGTEQLVYVNAIPTRVQFGNMQSRFAPEQIAANTDLAIAVAAREAELELLTLMYNAAKQVTPEQYLGATRDILATADLLAQQYRYSHRIPDNVPLTAVFPTWAKGVIRADLAREQAHDNAGTMNVLAISDAEIEEWFAARGINVIWTLDGVKAGTYGTGGSATTNQFFGLATAGAEPQWPGQTADGAFMVAWLLYVEGTYQFLDGGRLDLGVVRDSTLDATNDYETFVETFEGLAFRGIEAYQVQSLVKPSGASSVAITGTYHE